MSSRFLKHACKIKETDKNIGLPPLKPNANCWQKWSRFTRKLFMLNMTNAKTTDFFRNSSTMRNEMRRHATGSYNYIVHPFSILDLILEVVFVVVLVTKLCLLAFHIRGFHTVLDTAVDVFWGVLMVSYFFRGYTDFHTKTIYIKPKEICSHYLRTYFLFDVAILGSHWLSLSSEDLTVIVIVYCASFVSYSVRFSSFLSVLEHLLNFLNFKTISFMVYNLALVIGILHLLTCFVLTASSIILLIEAFHRKPASEMRMYDWYVGGFSVVIFHFFGAFYYPTDGGDTDDHPITNFYSFILLLVGRICTLILIARVLAFFGFTNMSASVYEQKIQQLLSFVRFKELPPHLKQRVILYFQSKYNGGFFDEKSLVASMSDSLRSELFLFGARKLISHQEAFKTLPSYVLGPLIAQMEYRIYLTGDVVLEKNSYIDRVYFISCGTLAGYNADDEEVLHLEEGGQFGLTSWLVYKSNITVLKWVAVEMSELYVIKRKDLRNFFDSQPEVAKYFETKMKERSIRYQCEPGGKWKSAKKSLIDELRRGILLKPPRTKIFGYDV